MNQLYVRPAKPEDANTFKDWQSQPDFDPAVLKYPDTFTLCAYAPDGPVAFLPIQQTQVTDILMLESVAFRPGSTDPEKATALRELVKASVLLGHIKGSEIYFVGTNPETNAFAERYGFERLPWPVYRFRT